MRRHRSEHGIDDQRPHIVETEPFGNTFGPKAQRKRPRLDIGSIEELGETTATAELPAEGEMAGDDGEAYHPTTSLMREPVYAKGTSRRIWGELYKVLDSSDVVIHVLDARDPMGTRCKPVVEYIRKEKAHKHLVYVLNKVDLVPTWVTVSTAFSTPPFLMILFCFRSRTPLVSPFPPSESLSSICPFLILVPVPFLTPLIFTLHTPVKYIRSLQAFLRV